VSTQVPIERREILLVLFYHAAKSKVYEKVLDILCARASEVVPNPRTFDESSAREKYSHWLDAEMRKADVEPSEGGPEEHLTSVQARKKRKRGKPESDEDEKGELVTKEWVRKELDKRDARADLVLSLQSYWTRQNGKRRKTPLPKRTTSFEPPPLSLFPSPSLLSLFSLSLPSLSTSLSLSVMDLGSVT
jgi:hypothetical protein